MQGNTGKTMRFVCAIAGAATLLAAGTGCQTGPDLSGPTRAVWVTRFDYRTPDDVRTIMQNCKQAGFNLVVFQVRGNGTVFYPSKIEPWAEQFNYTSPGFDPLALACAEAHGRGMQIHAWMNVMPAWRGTTPPTNPDHIYNKHPEWFWYDQNGQRQPLTSFYVSLNPCLPEVRSYLTSVFQEVAANYDIDGIHLDYIRFPNEPPAIPARSNIDYPRDAKTLALYKEATGKAPDDDREAWNQWRTDQVTLVVKDLHNMMRRVKPRAVLAASVGNNVRQSAGYFRDELRWAREGLIDSAYPMNYRPTLEQFDEGVSMWLPLRGQMHIVPGLWFDDRLPAEQGAKVVHQQIESAVQKTGNFCVFSYAGLFDSAMAPGALANLPTTQPANQRGHRRGGRDAERRQIRQKELLPFLQSLAQPQTPPA